VQKIHCCRPPAACRRSRLMQNRTTSPKAGERRKRVRCYFLLSSFLQSWLSGTSLLPPLLSHSFATSLSLFISLSLSLSFSLSLSPSLPLSLSFSLSLSLFLSSFLGPAESEGAAYFAPITPIVGLVQIGLHLSCSCPSLQQ
jgi:hypothetical protein